MDSQSKLARTLAGFPPYGGLKNEPGLPPFMAPGQFAAGYMPQMPPAEAFAPQDAPMPAAMPAPRPAPMPQMAAAPMPEPMPAGGQGYAGPEPMMPPAYDPMKDPRYLPEQWGGAFNPRWQA